MEEITSLINSGGLMHAFGSRAFLPAEQSRGVSQAHERRSVKIRPGFPAAAAFLSCGTLSTGLSYVNRALSTATFLRRF
jgi:hypothetical protein